MRGLYLESVCHHFHANFFHSTAYRFFEMVTEEGALRIMDEEATLPDSQFNQICCELTDIFSGKKMITEQSVSDGNETVVSFLCVLLQAAQKCVVAGSSLCICICASACLFVCVCLCYR